MSSSEYTEIVQFIGIVYAIWLTYVTIWKDSNKNDGFIGKCFLSIATLSVGFSMILAFGAILPLMIILFVGFYILSFFKG